MKYSTVISYWSPLNLSSAGDTDDEDTGAPEDDPEWLDEKGEEDDGGNEAEEENGEKSEIDEEDKSDALPSTSSNFTVSSLAVYPVNDDDPYLYVKDNVRF